MLPNLLASIFLVYGWSIKRSHFFSIVIIQFLKFSQFFCRHPRRESVVKSLRAFRGSGQMIYCVVVFSKRFYIFSFGSSFFFTYRKDVKGRPAGHMQVWKERRRK